MNITKTVTKKFEIETTAKIYTNKDKSKLEILLTDKNGQRYTVEYKKSRALRKLSNNYDFVQYGKSWGLTELKL